MKSAVFSLLLMKALLHLVRHSQVISTVYSLLFAIVWTVSLPPQPARNTKFASGPLDFILTYFSVFSE